MTNPSLIDFNPLTSTDNLVQDFGNQYLRFGQNTTPGVALNGESGSLYGPEYYVGNNTWLKGSYAFYNFGIGLAAGETTAGEGTNTWNLSGSLYRNEYDVYANPSNPNQGGGSLLNARKPGTDFRVDRSGLTGSTGSFTWSGVYLGTTEKVKPTAVQLVSAIEIR